MNNSYNDYINDVINKGLLCGEYKEKVSNAYGKHDLFYMLCDPNGITFLPEMSLKGIETPYNYFLSFFDKYVNGKYVSKFLDDDGNVRFSSCIYCTNEDNIIAKTTLLLCLNCRCDVIVNSGEYVRLIVDTNSRINLITDDDAMVNAEIFGNGKLYIKTQKGHIKIKEIKK